jgi:uncharacterized protein
MEHREEELIQRLLAHDSELRALYLEHQELKRKLEAFRHKLYLTPGEELEKKRIQKLKLVSKDRLMEVLHRHRPTADH